jgi:7-cyano-7-deazaguanine reductase
MAASVWWAVLDDRWARSGRMKNTALGYTEDHARAGIDAPLPAIDSWPNQFRGYEITIVIPEYTSICPKTGLPDFGTITIHYMPAERCLELKSLKYYILAYRNLGIFYENAVNRILRDIATACQPVWAVVMGEFNVRGGMRTVIEAKYPSPAPEGTSPRPSSPQRS